MKRNTLGLTLFFSTVLTLFTSSLMANDKACGGEFSKEAREKFIELCKSNRKLDSYKGDVFSKSSDKAEEVFAKYCVNTGKFNS